MAYFKDISYMLSHVFFMAFIYLFLMHRYSIKKTFGICFFSFSAVFPVLLFSLHTLQISRKYSCQYIPDDYYACILCGSTALYGQ